MGIDCRALNWLTCGLVSTTTDQGPIGLIHRQVILHDVQFNTGVSPGTPEGCPRTPLLGVCDAW